MKFAVGADTVAARPTAVVRARTTWPEYQSLWPVLSGEVWTWLRDAGITSGCPNVMLYLDDLPTVEVGVALADGPVTTGRIVRSELPGGFVAKTLCRGDYSGLGAAHDAIVEWCAEHGHRLAGPRWEIYGPHRNDPAEIETEVSYLLIG